MRLFHDGSLEIFRQRSELKIVKFYIFEKKIACVDIGWCSEVRSYQVFLDLFPSLCVIDSTWTLDHFSEFLKFLPLDLSKTCHFEDSLVSDRECVPYKKHERLRTEALSSFSET